MLDSIDSAPPEFRVTSLTSKLPPAPTYFQKPVSALNGHRGHVVRPQRCKWLNYEGEVVAVIGRACRNIAPDDAGDYIAGYTIGDDFGLHDFRETDAGSMLRVKGSDTLCPVGPGIVTDWDFHGKRIRTLVNGEVRQDGSTDEMTWDMHYLVADLARNITLLPGDLVFTGTPANSRPVQPGDGLPRLRRRRVVADQQRMTRDRGRLLLGVDHGDRDAQDAGRGLDERRQAGGQKGGDAQHAVREHLAI